MTRIVAPSFLLPLFRSGAAMAVACSLAIAVPAADGAVRPLDGSPLGDGGGSPAGTTGASGGAYAPWTSQPYASDELLVQFRSGTSRSDRARAAADDGAMIERDLTGDGLVKVRLRAGDRVEDAIDRWSRRPDVEYATVNLRGRAFFVPNDSVIAIVDLAWNLRSVRAFDAWDVQTGDPSVILAIIDSGVAHADRVVPDYERPFLWPGVTMYRQSPELPGPFLPGYDFIHDDPWADDDFGHGTQVATIAAGAANNVAGSAGIAFGVAIMPIKVLDYRGDSDMSYFIQGIRFAGDHHAHIANMSFGFPPLRFFTAVLGLTPNVLAHMFRPLKSAVEYAQRQGVILVAAAGNFDENEVSLPAAYPGVIAVGATGFDDRRTSYSSYGKDLDFMAPGGDVTERNGDGVQDQLFNLSIKPDRSEGSLAKPDSFGVFPFFGTSAASPHVAGAVALLLSKGYTNQGSIEQTLRATSIIPDGKPSGLNLEYGSGLIQLDAAVRAKAPGRPGAAAGAGPSARLSSSNPARGAASLAFRLSNEGRVRLRVFDVRGALVRTIEDRVMPAGERSAHWDGTRTDGTRVSAGIYLFRLETPEGNQSRKVVIVE
jgi:serine protease